MRVAHILRKYHPDEWGGTESAVFNLVLGLRRRGVESVMFAPQLEHPVASPDPLVEAGFEMRRYHAFVPAWRLSETQRKKLIALGGNLLSWDLAKQLRNEPDLDIIHTHALNRIGALALWTARGRKLPLVTTIHGGYLDIPSRVAKDLVAPLLGGLEWGKACGWLLRSRDLLRLSDLVLTCNPTEARALRLRHPHLRVVVQPHTVPLDLFAQDCRQAAWRAFATLEPPRPLVLVVARLEPTKNQLWLVRQWPTVLQRHPSLCLVLAGAATMPDYLTQLQTAVATAGLQDHVLLTGTLPPRDPRLIGLYQLASLLVLPSLAETFGMVIPEAWAAGTAVIASRTSGASSLVREGENGWLFDLDSPQSFHAALDAAMDRPEQRIQRAAAGRALVAERFSIEKIAGQVHAAYEDIRHQRRCSL